MTNKKIVLPILLICLLIGQTTASTVLCDASFVGQTKNQMDVSTQTPGTAGAEYLQSFTITGDITGASYSVIWRKLANSIVVEVYTTKLVYSTFTFTLATVTNVLQFVDAYQQYAVVRQLNGPNLVAYYLLNVKGDLTFVSTQINALVNGQGQDISKMSIINIAQLEGTARDVIVASFGIIDGIYFGFSARIDISSQKLVKKFFLGMTVGQKMRGITTDMYLQTNQGFINKKNTGEWYAYSTFTTIVANSPSVQTPTLINLKDVYAEFYSLSANMKTFKGVFFTSLGPNYGFETEIKVTGSEVAKIYTDNYYFFAASYLSDLIYTVVTVGSGGAVTAYSGQLSTLAAQTAADRAIVLSQFYNSLKVTMSRNVFYVLTASKMNQFTYDPSAKTIIKSNEITLKSALDSYLAADTSYQILLKTTCACIKKKVADVICFSQSFQCVVLSENSKTDCTNLPA